GMPWRSTRDDPSTTSPRLASRAASAHDSIGAAAQRHQRPTRCAHVPANEWEAASTPLHGEPAESVGHDDPALVRRHAALAPIALRAWGSASRCCEPSKEVAPLGLASLISKQ